jgi:hypothetical protein
VKCWGSYAGHLVDGTTIATGVPVDVLGLTSGVRAIAANEGYTCALTIGGGVQCWGNSPLEVVGLASGVSAIAAGYIHACAITSDGGVKCWGDNHYGQLGDGSSSNSSVPVDVSGLASGVTTISAGTWHTCALTSDGGVKCWGNNHSGQLGNGSTTESSVPVDVVGLVNGAIAVSAGTVHTCALTSGGGVKCWGNNDAVPVDVAGLTNGISAIAAGGGYTCALAEGGGVKCWGSNYLGRLGDGSTTDSASPVDVSGLASGVSAIGVGSNHACALMMSGGVKCWGPNEYGQLGNDTMAESKVPVDVDFALPGPTVDQSGVIEHATGPTEVVLQFDAGPDHSVEAFNGESFQPGPEFTLYGDGTVIFRNDGAQPPPAEGPIVRAHSFTIGHLNEKQIQSLMRFAFGEGGLGIALKWYDEGGEGCSDGYWIFTVHAGGVDKRVEVGGCGSPFGALEGRLRNGGGSLSTQVWVPHRYLGSLLEASSWIEQGVLPELPDTGAVPWPWSGIAPAEFMGLADPDEWNEGRRVMSAEEAAVLGLSDHGGVVQRIYLLGPDDETIYSFSLWPLLPDQPG